MNGLDPRNSSVQPIHKNRKDSERNTGNLETRHSQVKLQKPAMSEDSEIGYKRAV